MGGRKGGGVVWRKRRGCVTHQRDDGALSSELNRNKENYSEKVSEQLSTLCHKHNGPHKPEAVCMCVSILWNGYLCTFPIHVHVLYMPCGMHEKYIASIENSRHASQNFRNMCSCLRQKSSHMYRLSYNGTPKLWTPYNQGTL